MVENIEKRFIYRKYILSIFIQTKSENLSMLIKYVLFQTIPSIKIIDHNDFFNNFINLSLLKQFINFFIISFVKQSKINSFLVRNENENENRHPAYFKQVKILNSRIMLLIIMITLKNFFKKRCW